MKRQKGERWETVYGEQITITTDLANGYLRVLTDNGLLKVIHESNLREWLNKSDFPVSDDGKVSADAQQTIGEK